MVKVPKKRRVIKRVYEKGTERLVPSVKRQTFAHRQTKEIVTPQKLSAQRQLQAPIIDRFDLPQSYGITRLTLLVKDPFWLYAYWEVAQNDLKALKDKLPQWQRDAARLTLRIYDVSLINFNGHNANSYFDIDVGFKADNWYINLWHDNSSFVGEIGLKTQDGGFFLLARSNYVHTPRTDYSQRTEQIWMKVAGDKTAQPYVVPKIKPKLTEEKLFSKEESHKKRKVIRLREDDIRQYYGKLSGNLRDILSSRLRRLYARGGLKRQGFLLEGESQQDREKLFSRLPKGFFRYILGSSEQLIMGASEQLVKGASEFAQGKIIERKFFFEVATELIVYGRTEPDAEVFLGDNKINLRKDGTFSLRFALPDGKIPLEFSAISKDKKSERKIDIYVQRNTL